MEHEIDREIRDWEKTMEHEIDREIRDWEQLPSKSIEQLPSKSIALAEVKYILLPNEQRTETASTGSLHADITQRTVTARRGLLNAVKLIKTASARTASQGPHSMYFRLHFKLADLVISGGQMNAATTIYNH